MTHKREDWPKTIPLSLIVSKQDHMFCHLKQEFVIFAFYLLEVTWANSQSGGCDSTNNGQWRPGSKGHLSIFQTDEILLELYNSLVLVEIWSSRQHSRFQAPFIKITIPYIYCSDRKKTIFELLNPISTGLFCLVVALGGGVFSTPLP